MAYARERKESTVAESHDTDRPDIPPILVGFRGDHPVAMMMPTGGARDTILQAGKLLIVGMGCDTVSVSTEGWRATDPHTNPVTGEPWEHGQMEDVAYNHDGLAKGWITEMLNIMTVNRAGDLAAGLIEFTVTMSTNAFGIPSWTLSWGEESRWDSDGKDGTVGGVIPEELIAMMNLPDLMTEAATFDPIIAKLGAGLSYEEMRAHADCVVIKMLPRIGYEGGAMLLSDNPERQAVLHDSLRGHPDLYDMWSIRNNEGQGGWDSEEGQ
jgi:hypothetical protein